MPYERKERKTAVMFSINYLVTRRKQKREGSLVMIYKFFQLW